MNEQIGFIGTGQMGLPMARQLLDAGYRLRVYDMNASRLTPLTERGAAAVSCPGDAVEPGGLVLTMVPDDQALFTVALGEGGIAERLGSAGIHLSLSTISVNAARRLEAHYNTLGSTFLAATVLGRPDVAERGALTIFLAGEQAAKGRVLPLLRVLGKSIYELGEDTAAAVVHKLAANFMICAALETMGEAAALVDSYGTDRATFLRIMAQTPLFAGTVYQEYGAMIGKRDYSQARFPAPLGAKDLDLILEAAQHTGLSLPIAQTVYHHLRAALQQNRRWEDWSVLAEYAAEEGVAV